MTPRRTLALTLITVTFGAAAATARAGEPDDTVYRVEGGARPGRETAPAMAPSWCGEIAAPNHGRGAMQRTLSQVVEGGKLYAAAKGAQLLCDHPDRPAWREQTGQLVQVWVNFTGLGVKDAVTALTARANEARWEKERGELCATFAVDEEASDEDREIATAHRELFSCGNGYAGPMWSAGGGHAKVEWFLDRGADLPELLRAYLVVKHLRDPDEVKRDDFGFMYAVASYAVFGLDARRLDAARLDQEIAAMPRYGQVIARETHAVARLRAAGWKAHVDALAAKDETWRQLVVETPEKAFTAWSELRARNADAFDAVDGFEKVAFGPSRSAAKGCAAKLRPLFARAAAAAAAPSPELRDVLERLQGDPLASPIVERRLLCEAMDGDAGVATALYAATDRLRGYRGPRTAAALATLDHLNDVKADREKFPLEAKDLPRFARDAFRGAALERGKQAIFMDDGKGVVKSVKPVDGGVLVSFKGEAVKETNWDCKRTNRVRRIDASGNVEYWSDCKNLGQVTVTKTPSPVVVPRELDAGIAAGRYMTWKVDIQLAGAVRKGTPVAVYDSPAQKKLVALYGVSL
jgi:hypothetical protein